MAITRRIFLGQLAAGAAAFSQAVPALPANRNVKWALSLALWSHLPPCPFTEVLDIMRDTGFIGIRLRGFPSILDQYQLTLVQLHREVSRRGLYIASISLTAPLADPAQRQKALDTARDSMKFLADFGANHLVVFPPDVTNSAPVGNAAFGEMCERCNQIGELAGEMGFTAGLHNHLGSMVQTQRQLDQCMAMTDPKLFGLSPDTAHLLLGGCDVAGTLRRYQERIHFLDYKDARWTTPAQDWVEANGNVLRRDTVAACFAASVYDLGDGEVDFPACHRVLKSAAYRGWICVDLDTVRQGALASYRHCGRYIVRNLEPIYA